MLITLCILQIISLLEQTAIMFMVAAIVANRDKAPHGTA